MTEDRFATLAFTRHVAAPVGTLWQAWTAPAARALWAPPSAGVTVEFLQTATEVGGLEVSLCKAPGHPDIRAEVRWLHLDPGQCSVNSEVISSAAGLQGAALVTAEFHADGEGSRIDLTVQLAAFAADMADGYRQGYGAGVANLSSVAERTMVISRIIAAPTKVVWGAWMNAESLPQWWGPDGFSCRTSRIDLRAGGEWVFDMIAPDGTVFPNHHRYGRMVPGQGFDYTLHWGENGPKHADAWAGFETVEGGTRVTLGMVFATAEEYRNAKGFGAEALGLQTLGKLAMFVGVG
jgi:uncharacterized protein YndB with AHSA1/START domain